LKERTCPICGKKIGGGTGVEEGKNYPFCSERCQMVDLGHWFSDEYVIRGGSQEESEGDKTIQNEK